MCSCEKYSEAVDEADHLVGLRVGEHGGDRQRELPGVDGFRDGKAQMSPFAVGGLPVGGNGVVYEGLHSVCLKITLELLSPGG